jgi:hypothetical protein
MYSHKFIVAVCAEKRPIAAVAAAGIHKTQSGFNLQMDGLAFFLNIKLLLSSTHTGGRERIFWRPGAVFNIVLE